MMSEIANFVQIAALNKAAGDPFRLELLRVLAQDAYGVLELCDIFAYKQSGMSHHLKVLAEAGLVTKRREGNSIFYSRALPASDAVLAQLQQHLYAALDQITLPEALVKRVDAAKLDRAVLSQAFFAQHAEQFKEQQDLIAEYPIYGQAVADLLAKTELPSSHLAVEIGPGQGEFLPVLSAQFATVIAVDNAAPMLAQAQQRCAQQALTNIRFVCNNTDFFASSEAVDCVVMNMVLHHTPSPAAIFSDIAKGLKSGGVLIVTELCRHDQDWAKTACGDLWLGFDPDELQYWAQLAGLKNGNSHYFALRNGFQIQLQQFVKV